MIGPPGERGAPTAESAPFEITARQDCEAMNRLSGRAVESGLSCAEAVVLELVRHAARMALPAPTSDEIADVAQVESLSTPTAILRRLQLRGLIYVESFQRGRRIWLPDGRATAPPRCTTPPWRWREDRSAS